MTHNSVEELLRWQVRGDPNFNPAEIPFHEKAVKALVRKLKRGKEKGSSQVLYYTRLNIH